MRVSMKLLPVLLLGSALGGCSMAGTGDYFADEYAARQAQQMPYKYGQSQGCAYTGCETSYSVAAPHVQTQAYGHQDHAYSAPHQPQTPNAHAYGQAVQHGAYGAAGYGAAHKGLRGKYQMQPYTYGNLGAVNYDVNSDFYGIQGRAGYQSAKYIGAELEASVGLTDETSDIVSPLGNSTLEQKIDNQIAGFLVGRLPLSQKFNVLARGGYHNTEISSSLTDTLGTVDNDFSTDGVAYGVGAEYNLNPKTSIRADYTIYDFEGADADALSLAIARKF